jgi:RHS repeat-associated protein
MTDLKLGNNLWEHTSFNTRLQPTEIGLGTTQSGVDRLKLNYSYGTTNNNGNVQSQTITIPNGPTLSQSYEYDQLNRLKIASEQNSTTQCRDQQNNVVPCWKQSFIYDRYGNRTFNTIAGETTPNVVGSLLTIDQVNNRFTAAGQGSILYDSAGNLTRDFNGHTFGYDGENRQVAYDGGATTGGGVSYFYDGDGRRVKKVNGGSLETTIFVYDAAGQMVAEYSTSNQQPTGGTSYLTSDNLGTPRIITDASGSVKARHDYLPFGEELGYNATLNLRSIQQGYAGDNLRQKFTQKERDSETGLDYFGARYYGSMQGRFTSTDPLLSSGTIYDPQTWNRYAYALNNPVRYIDPLGLFEWDTSLGGAATDAELKKMKGGQKIIERRNEFRKAMGQAAFTVISGELTDDQQSEVIRSLRAYGGEGEANGVTVANGKTNDNEGAVTTSNNQDGFTADPTTGAVTPSIKVTFNEKKSIDPEGVAHEGSHVADREDLVAVLTPLMTTKDWVKSSLNVTRYATEFRAYQVSSAVAQGRGEATYNANGYEYWNSGWKAAERATKMTNSINKLLDKSYHVTQANPGSRIIELKP